MHTLLKPLASLTAEDVMSRNVLAVPCIEPNTRLALLRRSRVISGRLHGAPDRPPANMSSSRPIPKPL